MKFKKNIIPLGSSTVASARAVFGGVEFFMLGEGVIVRKTFDLAAHTLTTDARAIAYADGYLALSRGAVQNLGGLFYAAY